MAGEKAKAMRIVKFLEARYGMIRHRYRDPFRVLISCILSQRTSARNTAAACKKLFAVARTPGAVAKLPIAELQELIRPAGFWRGKARAIKETSKIIVKRYKGKVPRERKALLELPGVGWKTSAIVMSYGYGQPIIAIDVHCARIAKRIGIADEADDVETVREKLQRFFPRRKWLLINLSFVRFGREICLPRKPKCSACPFTTFCRASRTKRFAVQPFG